MAEAEDDILDAVGGACGFSGELSTLRPQNTKLLLVGGGEKGSGPHAGDAVMCKETGIKHVRLAAGRACKDGIDDGGDAAPRDENGQVVGAGAFDAVAEVGGGSEAGQDGENPLVAIKQLTIDGAEGAFDAADTGGVAGRAGGTVEDANLDELRVAVNANPVGGMALT